MAQSERFTARLTLTLLVSLCFLLMCYRVDDRDIWLHLRTGRLIVETGSVPRTDPYSYTAEGTRWVYPSWLTAVLMHGAYQVGGVPAVQVFTGLINTAALVAMLALLRRRGVGSLAMIVSGLLLARVLMVRSAPRPYVFTHLLMVAFCALLSDFHRRGRQPYVLLPLMTLWANLHAGFVAGLLLLLPHGVAAVVAAWRRPRAMPWRFAIVCGGVGLAALVNPYGWQVILHPLRVTGIGPTLKAVSEWQGLGFQPPTWPFWQLMTATALGSALTLLKPRRLALADVLPALIFFCLTLTAVRHLAICAIVATPLLADRLDLLLDGKWLAATRRRVSVLLCATGCICFLAFNAISAGHGRLGLPPGCHPVAGVEFALKHGVRGRMFNEFGKGAYILWRAWPKYRVFIDGRLSVYGRKVNEDWRAITWMYPGWQQLLDEYGIDFILGDNRLHPAYYSLPDWRLIYWDDVSRILVKPTPDRQQLIERYECALTCPDTFDARRLKRHGSLPQAIAQLEQKVEADPDCLAAHLSLGQCYLLEHRFAEAERPLLQAHALDPNNPTVCQSLGACLHEMGQLEQALPYLHRVRRFNPRSIEPLLALGECDFAMNDRSRAYSVFEAALGIAPQSGDAKRGVLKTTEIPHPLVPLRE